MWRLTTTDRRGNPCGCPVAGHAGALARHKACPYSALLLTILLSAPAFAQDTVNLVWKFRSLQNDWTSNSALPWFLAHKNDPEIRKYLAIHLPAALDAHEQRDDGVPDITWGNEAQVAGEFKIAEAAPALAGRMDTLTHPRSGGSFAENFFDYAAAHALIQIGPPAVPYVIEVLKHRNHLCREIAVYILSNVGTGDAWRAIEDDLPGETNVHVRERIEGVLASRQNLQRPK